MSSYMLYNIVDEFMTALDIQCIIEQNVIL